ncbi:hypothetical protein XAUB_38780 [Xanthomonas citri pv. aurantifolii str. ICPB 11122]|nr:hypothetical protein XAUB_38780 [Xanthomonas citri pv. aurantifolii str. ICPB 11122]
MTMMAGVAGDLAAQRELARGLELGIHRLALVGLDEALLRNAVTGVERGQFFRRHVLGGHGLLFMDGVEHGAVTALGPRPRMSAAEVSACKRFPGSHQKPPGTGVKAHIRRAAWPTPGLPGTGSKCAQCGQV